MKEFIKQVNGSSNRHPEYGECFVSENTLQNCPSNKFVSHCTFNYEDFAYKNTVYDLIFVEETLRHGSKYMETGLPSKHFTMLNGNPWLPRPILLLKLLENVGHTMNWTANNFIDPNNPPYDENETEYDYTNLVERFNNIAGRHWNGIKFTQVPDNKDYQHIWDLNANDVALIQDGLFQIVCDTNCDLPASNNKGQHFISPKLFKCFLSKRPLIYMSNNKHGVYDILKREGFKTFDSVIDESFDTQKDPNIKLDNIAELCNNISTKDIKQLYDNTRQICEHNYNAFITKDWLNFANRYNVEI